MSRRCPRGQHEDHDMDTASDTRPAVSGHPLPWSIEADPILGDNVVDADGEVLLYFDADADHRVYEGMVAAVNRASGTVPVRPDEILFIAGAVRGLLDMLVKPDDGTQHRATVGALASIRDMLNRYVPDAQRLIRDGFARRDVGAEREPG